MEHAEKVGWNIKMNRVERGKMRHIRQRIEIERTEGRRNKRNYEKARKTASQSQRKKCRNRGGGEEVKTRREGR